MALEVYYPQDIRNALLAAEQASNAAFLATGRENDQFAEGYQAGYRAALATIALAFGLIRTHDLSESHEWEQVFLPANGKARY
ncbi:MAG: hypothetical protein JSV36_20420 [Anaerolineae bacterium]|nr:MAG: hypothetical protein JSV36_20420 [Anaerolineae bacterium]